MQEQLEQLMCRIADWPPEVQQKIVDAIRAIQAEYIDCKFDDELSSD